MIMISLLHLVTRHVAKSIIYFSSVVWTVDAVLAAEDRPPHSDKVEEVLRIAAENISRITEAITSSNRGSSRTTQRTVRRSDGSQSHSAQFQHRDNTQLRSQGEAEVTQRQDASGRGVRLEGNLITPNSGEVRRIGGMPVVGLGLGYQGNSTSERSFARQEDMHETALAVHAEASQGDKVRVLTTYADTQETDEDRGTSDETQRRVAQQAIDRLTHLTEQSLRTLGEISSSTEAAPSVPSAEAAFPTPRRNRFDN